MSLPQLKNMVLCAEAGAMVLPAMPAFYQGPKTLDDLADFMAGKILSALGFEHACTPHGRGSARQVSVQDRVDVRRDRRALRSSQSPLLSLGLDRRWRARAVAELGLSARVSGCSICARARETSR